MSATDQIQAAITGFNWSNYGLDEVDDADIEYAEALATQIATALGLAPEPADG